jgi:hypothetical protein
MIDLVKKYQKQISFAMAVSVLVLCYYQRKEINTLREQLNIKEKVDTTLMNVDKQSDSLIKQK